MHHKLLCLPYQDWMDAFLPAQAKDAEIDDTKFADMFNSVPLGGTEDKMYDPFVKAVNGAGILDGFMVAKTYARPDPTDKDKLKVDGGMYPKDCPAAIEHRTDWASVEVFIECKLNDSCDPYDESTASGFPYADPQRDALGQISTYASHVFEYQHLTHHFGVVLLGTCARLGRWDRSGVVFSSKFDYKKEPAKLARFFWRVAHATPEARGHDPTATRVIEGSEDYRLLQEWAAKAEVYAQNPALAKDDYVEKQFVDSLNGNRPWWRLKVTDGKHGTKEFLVGKPTFSAPGVVGRGTRGYIALCISDPGTPFMYLKDCWRVVHERSELEGNILSYLNAKGVTNIPTALYHGDVEGQRTASQDFCKCAKSGCKAEVVEKRVDPTMGGRQVVQNADGARGAVGGISGDRSAQTNERAEGARQSSQAAGNGARQTKKEICRLKTHRHYRLVVKEVGLPLKEFPCGRILVWSIRDAIIAHQDAYENARIMHRDISVGNILIIPPTSKNGRTTYQGLLADWELSKRLDDYEHDARHPDRTGTWQFMSVYIQDHPEAQVDIADELESFLHVMIYCAIRYLPHTCTNVGDFMYQFFDDGVRRGEADYTCGASKRLIMQTGQLTTLWNENIIFLRRRRDPDAESHTEEDFHPINELFTALLQYFVARYLLVAKSAPKTGSRPRFTTYINRNATRDQSGSQQREPEPQTTVQTLLTQVPKYLAWYVHAARGALRASVSRFAAYLDASGSQSQSSEPCNSPEERYKCIKTHSHLIAMLDMASEQEASEWPGPEDRLPDQLHPEYKPKREVKTREKRTAPVGEPDEQPPSKRRCTASGRTASRV